MFAVASACVAVCSGVAVAGLVHASREAPCPASHAIRNHHNKTSQPCPNVTAPAWWPAPSSVANCTLRGAAGEAHCDRDWPIALAAEAWLDGYCAAEATVCAGGDERATIWCACGAAANQYLALLSAAAFAPGLLALLVGVVA